MILIYIVIAMAVIIIGLKEIIKIHSFKRNTIETIATIKYIGEQYYDEKHIVNSYEALVAIEVNGKEYTREFIYERYILP